MRQFKYLSAIIFAFLFTNDLKSQDLWDCDAWPTTSVSSSFYDGTGTKKDPYQIRTGAQLMYFFSLINAGNDFKGKTVKLMNDIYITEDYEGDDKKFVLLPFAGEFDGGCHFISILHSLYHSNEQFDGLFTSIFGHVHHLGLINCCRSGVRDDGYDYGGKPYIAKTIEVGGIIEDCFVYFGNNSKPLVTGKVPLLAWSNYGTIRNCYGVRDATTSYFYSRWWGERFPRCKGFFVYENYGLMENCFAQFPDEFDGLFEINHGQSINNTDNLDELNAWVSEHPEHSLWTDNGQYKLAVFNPKEDVYDVEFVDTLFHTTLPSIEIPHGETIGTLPIPDADCTFDGWIRLGKKVSDTDILESNWTLFASWKQSIRKQPTTSNLSIEVDDDAHASYNWFGIFGTFIQFADWQSTNHERNTVSADTIKFTANSNQKLQFSYDVSSELGCDEFYAYINGKCIAQASGIKRDVCTYEITEGGDYTLILKYMKDESGDNGKDMVFVSHIQLFDTPENLNCKTSILPQEKIMNNGYYYCVVHYSNTGKELTSEIIYSEVPDMEDYTHGDVNLDEKIDITDVVCVVNNILGVFPYNTYSKAADMNDDGVVDISDVVMLVNKILNQ